MPGPRLEQSGLLIPALQCAKLRLKDSLVPLLPFCDYHGRWSILQSKDFRLRITIFELAKVRIVSDVLPGFQVEEQLQRYMLS